MKNYSTYTVEIEKGEDGHFVVSVPSLPGCFSQGNSMEEAVAMAQDAIRGYLQVLTERGEPIPVEKPSVKKFRLTLVVPTPVLA